MSELPLAALVGSKRAPRPKGRSRRVAAEPSRRPPPAVASELDWAQLPREAEPEEPYRPELVARLERAVREGRYHPDPRAIADALVRVLDTLP